jgi:ribosomal protein S18 acetylase RimI-like enzyme
MECCCCDRLRSLDMIEHSNGLSARALKAIAELEQRVLLEDGGRLKLEWSTLRSRPKAEVNDLLWWNDQSDRLLGYLGLYRFDSRNIEMTGMVDPSVRRRGIASKLLRAALERLNGRSFERALLVTPRFPAAGTHFALAQGWKRERSEYALVLTFDPVGEPSKLPVSLRAAEAADMDVVARLLREAFGYVKKNVDEQHSDEHQKPDTQQTLVVLFERQPVGTLRVTLEGDQGGVYGFVVDPLCRGQGVGREALRQACTDLRLRGAARIGLEVAAENERAIGLYTSLGFAPVMTEDYYRIVLTHGG